jgi:preprotein translocase subunit SecA
VIYAQRKKVLDGENLRDSILSILQGVVDSEVMDTLSENGGVADAAAVKRLLGQMENIYFPKGSCKLEGITDAEELKDAIYQAAVKTYEEKEVRLGQELMRELERVIMLRVVDEYWMDNIDAMDDLKQGIGLRAYGQHDPVIAYKEEGYQMFEAMIRAIREETVRRVFTVQVHANTQIQRQKVAKETAAVGSGDSVMKKQPVRSTKKAGPNDPCPCGSGLKYKKCCMQKDKTAN